MTKPEIPDHDIRIGLTDGDGDHVLLGPDKDGLGLLELALCNRNGRSVAAFRMPPQDAVRLFEGGLALLSRKNVLGVLQSVETLLLTRSEESTRARVQKTAQKAELTSALRAYRRAHAELVRSGLAQGERRVAAFERVDPQHLEDLGAHYKTTLDDLCAAAGESAAPVIGLVIRYQGHDFDVTWSGGEQPWAAQLSLDPEDVPGGEGATLQAALDAALEDVAARAQRHVDRLLEHPAPERGAAVDERDALRKLFQEQLAELRSRTERAKRDVEQMMRAQAVHEALATLQRLQTDLDAALAKRLKPAKVTALERDAVSEQVQRAVAELRRTCGERDAAIAERDALRSELAKACNGEVAEESDMSAALGLDPPAPDVAVKFKAGDLVRITNAEQSGLVGGIGIVAFIKDTESPVMLVVNTQLAMGVQVTPADAELLFAVPESTGDGVALEQLAQLGFKRGSLAQRVGRMLEATNTVQRRDDGLKQMTDLAGNAAKEYGVLCEGRLGLDILRDVLAHVRRKLSKARSDAEVRNEKDRLWRVGLCDDLGLPGNAASETIRERARELDKLRSLALQITTPLGMPAGCEPEDAVEAVRRIKMLRAQLDELKSPRIQRGDLVQITNDAQAEHIGFVGYVVSTTIERDDRPGPVIVNTHRTEGAFVELAHAQLLVPAAAMEVLAKAFGMSADKFVEIASRLAAREAEAKLAAIARIDPALHSLKDELEMVRWMHTQARRWEAVAGVLGICATKDPPADIAGFIDTRDGKKPLQDALRAEFATIKPGNSARTEPDLNDVLAHLQREQAKVLAEDRAFRTALADALSTGRAMTDPAGQRAALVRAAGDFVQTLRSTQAELDATTARLGDMRKAIGLNPDASPTETAARLVQIVGDVKASGEIKSVSEPPGDLIEQHRAVLDVGDSMWDSLLAWERRGYEVRRWPANEVAWVPREELDDMIVELRREGDKLTVYVRPDPRPHVGRLLERSPEEALAEVRDVLGVDGDDFGHLLVRVSAVFEIADGIREALGHLDLDGVLEAAVSAIGRMETLGKQYDEIRRELGMGENPAHETLMNKLRTAVGEPGELGELHRVLGPIPLPNEQVLHGNGKPMSEVLIRAHAAMGYRGWWKDLRSTWRVPEKVADFEVAEWAWKHVGSLAAALGLADEAGFPDVCRFALQRFTEGEGLSLQYLQLQAALERAEAERDTCRAKLKVMLANKMRAAEQEAADIGELSGLLGVPCPTVGGER